MNEIENMLRQNLKKEIEEKRELQKIVRLLETEQSSNSRLINQLILATENTKKECLQTVQDMKKECLESVERTRKKMSDMAWEQAKILHDYQVVLDRLKEVTELMNEVKEMREESMSEEGQNG